MREQFFNIHILSNPETGEFLGCWDESAACEISAKDAAKALEHLISQVDHSFHARIQDKVLFLRAQG